MIKVKAIGAAEIERDLEKLAKKAGLLGPAFADFAAGAVQKEVVKRVQPWGVGKKSRRLGEVAVYRDLNKIFQRLPMSAVGPGVIRSIAEASRYHQSLRGSRGKTVTPAEKRPILAAVLDAYTKQVIKRVGRAKGGFTSSAKVFNNRIPKWISEHASEGAAVRSKNAMGVGWTFTNRVDHISARNVMGKYGLAKAMKVQNMVIKRALSGRLRRMGLM